MADFSIFTGDHLAAAEFRLADLFESEATSGRLHNARSTHADLLAVRAELERRAIAGLRKSEAA